MWKYLLRVILLGTGFLVGYLTWDSLGGWAILAGLGASFGLLVVGAYLYAAIAFLPFCPLRIQRPVYNHWKKQVQEHHKQHPIHPLVDFPLSVYMQLQLDKEFEAGGIRQAQQALKNYLESMPSRVEAMFNTLREAQAKKQAHQQS